MGESATFFDFNFFNCNKLFFGLLIDLKEEKYSKFFLGMAILLNLLILGFFKYFNFFLENLNIILSHSEKEVLNFKQVALPIGISFFTFQAISYLIDVYRKTAPAQKNIFNLALYISLFPQLIAGPIVRYAQISAQLEKRELNFSKTASGIQRFIFGFAKKIIVANSMASIADQVFAISVHEMSTGVIWLGIIAYTFQIYFDFSGYSDMAIGLGKMFGFDIPENFNFPYISKSIKEFWRRWHISLSSWFKDYLYIPLGGNRGTKARTLLNLLIVFFCTGFWHGASWNFVIWGLFHGTFLLIERVGFGKFLKKIWSPIRLIYTLLVVIVGWVFFRIESFSDAIQYISAMFSLHEPKTVQYFLLEFFDKKQILIFAFAILYSLRFFRRGNEFFHHLFYSNVQNDSYKYLYSGLKFVFSIGIFMISIMYLAGSTYNPFIYFRF